MEAVTAGAAASGLGGMVARRWTRGAVPRLLVLAAVLTGAKLVAYAVLARGGLPDALCQWDCHWYVQIAEDGYSGAARMVDGHMQAGWAFFPLMPLLLHWVGALTGLTPEVAGMSISTAALAAFLALGALHRGVTRPGSRALPWMLLVTVWPYSFYFNAQYSEAVFAAIAMAGLLALAAGHRLWGGVSCALLSATRPTGALFSAALIAAQAWRLRTAGSARQAARLMLPAVVAPLGLLMYVAFLWGRTGDPLAFAHVQTGWGRSGGNPLQVLLDAFAAIDVRGLHFGLAYNAGWALLGLGAAAWLAWRRLGFEAWLCGGTVLMALGSGVVWSMPRFVAANPALLLAAADVLDRLPRMARAAVLVVLGVVQVVFLLAWYRGAVFLM